MQNLNNHLVVSKLAWRTGWTFIKTLKNLSICTLMGSFCPKCNVSARKCQRHYVPWHWKWSLSEDRLINLVNFHASSWKFSLDGFFLSKAYKVLDEKVQKSVSHDTGEWCKVCRKTGSENLHFDVLLLPIAYKISAKKVQKSYLSWYWRVIQTYLQSLLTYQIYQEKLTFCLKNDMSESWKIWKFALWWDIFVWSM